MISTGQGTNDHGSSLCACTRSNIRGGDVGSSLEAQEIH